ncbi:unnamed protein product [Arctia plantaginis]|uniref:G-patch domain-containing protein n=1 Tax=Arctia plantaginis TaxID=874455 RepID=A0A8S1A933_ARCPL|nr:unnamed protein product [Arctia plantaginis]
MASSEDNLDSGMDYQENISVSNTVSSNDDYEKSSQFVSSAACSSALEPNIDLKTCEFDVLLNYLSNEMIFKNIRAIYNFLKGNNDEIEFRYANMYMEEILVRIVRNVGLLRSERFTQACALYCKLIIDLIEDALSKRIYMVACIYKNEKDHLRDRLINYKILTYKKLYYTSPYKTQMQIFDGPTSIMSMSSIPPMSRSTSVDSLDSQRSNFDIKPSLNPFILHCLRLILNFVKDQTQLSLNFSGLNNSETVYFHSVFTSAIDEKFDNGTLCKNVYRAIWEAVKICSLKFDFRIRNLRCSLNTKSLLLEKRIKLSDCTDDTDESEASLIISVCKPAEKKFVKNIINYIRSPAVRSVFNDEPRSIMEQLNELLDNQSNYRLKTSGKNKFGQNDVKFMKIPKFEDRFPQQNRRPCDMECINMPPHEDLTPRQSIKSCDGEAKIVPLAKDSTPQQSTSCDVEYLDIPPPDQSPPQQRSRTWYPRGETVPRNQGAMRKAYLKTGAGFQQSAHGHGHLGWDQLYAPPGLDASFQPSGINQMINSEADPVLTEMMIKYGNRGAPKNKKQLIDSIGHQPKPKPVMPRGKDCRNDQLLEAMSVPVQSDKALKMMFSMGWTGGALGARGSGITEPIMPNLNSGYGAGLGHKIHIKKNKKLSKGFTPVATPSVTSRILATMSSSNRPGYIFREIFLTHLLDLLTSTDDSTILKLCPNINKKEIAFVNHTIKNLAGRAKIKLDDDGQNIVDNIEIHYRKDPEMLVTACIHDDKKHLVLTKVHGLGNICHSEEARNQRLAMAEEITKNMSDFMIHYGPMVYTQKSYDEIKFKVLYLLEVLKLVKDNTLNHLVVDMVMTLREKNLLRQGLNSINKNKKIRDKTPDAVLFLMIRKFMGSYTVDVKFTKEYTQFTLYKEYLVPSMVAGAHLTYEYAEMQGQINNDTESDHDLNENDDEINVKENVKIENDDMEPDENKTESDNRNNELEQKAVTTEGNEIVKTLIIDEKMDVHNEYKLTSTSSINEYSTDEMSISDQSGFTTNLDYNENEDTDISDDKLGDVKSKGSDNHMKIESDNLDLSAISETTLNVDFEEQSYSEDKSDVKVVYLTKNCVFSEDTPKFLQSVISYNIIKTKQLPLLVCHGVHSDALIYSCHTKKSYEWLLNTCIANRLTIFTKEVDKMSLRINSYYEIYDKHLFKLLELYNKELSTKEWSVLKKEKMSDCVVFDVKMDKKSVKFILESMLSLYAGIDKVTFSIILE